jgi:serine protein kinase
MNLFDAYRDQYVKARDEEMSLVEYLDLCKRDPLRLRHRRRTHARTRSATPEIIDTSQRRSDCRDCSPIA